MASTNPIEEKTSVPGSGGDGVITPSNTYHPPGPNLNATPNGNGYYTSDGNFIEVPQNPTTAASTSSYVDKNGVTQSGINPDATRTPTTTMSSDAAAGDHKETGDTINTEADLIRQEQDSLRQTLDANTAQIRAEGEIQDRQLAQTQTEENATNQATQFRLGREGTDYASSATQKLNQLHLDQQTQMTNQRQALIGQANAAYRAGNIALAKELVQNAKDVAQQQAQAKRDAAQQQSQDIQNALNQSKFDYQKQQDIIDNQFKSTTLDQKTKQDAFDNAMKSANFNLEQKKFLSDQYFKQQDLYLKQQANNPGSEGTHPSVKMTANNTPSKADQASFLTSLGNPDLQALVKGIADYDINPASVPTKNYKGVGGLNQSQILSLVSQYDPSFSQSNYASRQALKTNFASGKYSQNINSFNTVIGHIAELQDSFNGLHNRGFTPYNTATNNIQKLFGAGGVGKAALNIAAATGELATTFKNSGATDAEMEKLGVLDANSSPDQVKQYIEAATRLLGSKLQALDDTYTNGMGKSPDKPFLSLTSQKDLLNLQKSGFDIQVPELANSPLIKISTFHDSDPKNAALLDQLIQAQPSLKNDPYGLMDILAQNGVEL